MTIRERISLFYPDSKARLGELVIDAFIQESHEFSSELTEHPVENGSVLADHIINKPFSLTIDGIISNTPMTLLGLTAFDSAQRYAADEKNDVVSRAFSTIEKLFAKRTPLSIATSFKTYHKMVLETLSIERGEGFYKDSLHFTCTAKQIHLAHQERIEIPIPKTSRCKPKQKKGLQETKPLSPKKVDKTWLKNLFGEVSLSPGNIE
jgi:hypothetical protein